MAKEKVPVRLGDTARFIPAPIKPDSGTRYPLPPPVDGVVVGIFPKHQYFRCIYKAGGETFSECFKFWEIGKSVEIVG